MTNIYLIRHGEAEGNVFRRLHGQYNSLLMPRGFEQRACVQKRFENIHIDACFSSDLTRACLTAASIYVPKGLELQRDARFRELDVGQWEDLAYGYLDRYYPRDMHNFSHNPVIWQVSGSETYEEYTGRFIEAMEEKARLYDGGTIAIFCHGAVLRGTLMRLFFNNEADKLPLSDNAGVSHLYYDHGKFTYAYLNDNSHIPERLSTFYIQSWWRKTDNRKEANLYFEPYSPEDGISGLQMPDREEGGLVLTGKLYNGPVGVVSMGTPQDTTGRILGITLLESKTGRYYTDQLLGAAFSHFRNLGCKALQLSPGDYPEDIVQRYGFDPETLSRSIDANIFM